MKVAPSVLLVVLATLLLGFSSIAAAVAPPTHFGSRDVFVLAIAVAGLIFSVLAGRELVRINRQLRQVAA
ncbi:hypothetical protein [Pseudoxanthomonas sp.]|uniref:hypothetical protein n=1 Tax=Pseudoxanthomonas sp. TaxID=1871049 RepID=UPI0026290ED9|nr:hypothetical protein [Pseudoxanthomonas sp.]WDS37096.1 MAG: hypothetical protein O8I58_04135 [Pseudoxanthomonas sp.]